MVRDRLSEHWRWRHILLPLPMNQLIAIDHRPYPDHLYVFTPFRINYSLSMLLFVLIAIYSCYVDNRPIMMAIKPALAWSLLTNHQVRELLFMLSFIMHFLF